MNIEERSRIDRMLKLGCVVCRHFGKFNPAEVHHLTEGGRRLGHWYTIPLCPPHHRGTVQGVVSVASGSRAFEAAYGSQLLLWEEVQQFLGLEVKWPVSKIMPRVA